MGIVRDQVRELVEGLEKSASECELELWKIVEDEGITTDNMGTLNQLALKKLTAEAFAKDFKGLMERV